MTRNSAKHKQPHNRLRGLVVLIVLLVVMMAAFFYAPQLRTEALAEHLRGFGVLGPALLMAAMVLAVIVGPIPTIPITATAGLVYGPILGTVYAALGALIGAVASFWIARLAGRDLIAQLLRGHIAFCEQCSDRLLFWVVLGARLVPVVSFALVSYGAGLTRMSTRAFAIATLFGMLPMTIVYTTLGATVRISSGWALVGGILVVVVLLLLPMLVERYDPFGLKRLLERHDKH